MSAESPDTNRSRVTVSSTSGWDYVYGDSVDLSASDYSEIFDIDVAATGDVFVTGLFYGSFEGLDSGGSTRRFVQHRGSDGSISWTIDLDEAAAAHDCDAEPAEVYPGDSSTTFVDGSGNFYASSATLATVRHADLVACPTLQITPSGALRTPDYASWPSLGLQCPCNGEDSFSPGSLGGALSIAPRPTGGVYLAQLQGTSLNVFALDGDLQLKVWSQPEISADFLGDDFALTVSRNDDLWLAATLNEPSPVLPDPLALIKMDSTGSFTKILNYDFEWAGGLVATFRDDSIWISGMVSEYRDIMCPECEPMDKDSGGKYFGTWSLDTRTGALIGRVSGTGDPSSLAYQGDWCVASTWRLGPFAYLNHESGLQINDACRSKVDLDAIDEELTNRLWWISLG